jgi:hypothetical protein
MCLLGDHPMLSNDLHWDPRVTVEWTEAPGKVIFTGIYNWEPNRLREHPADCASCSMKGLCMGVYGRYLQRWGPAGLSPLKNSEKSALGKEQNP